MKNLNKISKVKREEIKTILSNEDVIKYFDSIKIFGSAITDHCREDSDIDMFVALKPEYANDQGANDAFFALITASESGKDIFFAHEQHGEFNPGLYEAMLAGVEVL